METLSVFPEPALLPHAAPGGCAACPLSPICHAAGDGDNLPAAPASRARRLVRQGEAVYRAGDPLLNLYFLRSGSVKIRSTNPAGLEQITAFPIAGALLGLDAMETGAHASDAIALEDSFVCVLPFADLMRNCRRDFAAARLFHRLMARDINECRQLLLALGRMTTEQRVARFLMGMSEQMAAGGYSPREFVLKMTREDISNHLGMKVETVCRVLSRLQAASLVKVDRRRLEIRNIEALRKMSRG
ncbi:helix-turn-helix domain-containing protein [Achromobacter denitrificans]